MPRVRSLLLLACVLTLLSLPDVQAERIGDLNVSPQAMVSGETQHGYREIRVLVENQSLKDAHRVTLIYPNRSYGAGNCLSRVSRTVVVNPSSRALVPLWLPPLPANGDGYLRVEMDDYDPATVSVPGGIGHVRYSGARYGGGLPPSTILVSRSLNFDELNKAFKGEQTEFAASAATGPPNSGGRRGPANTAWMPDHSGSGPHWIELDYNQPIVADQLCIYETMGMLPFGEIVLTGTSGTNLLRIPLSGGSAARSRRSAAAQEYSFSLTAEPVKTVRLEFSSSYGPGSISIDAVQLTNSTTSNGVWASSARASSEGGYAARTGGVEARALLRAETPVEEWSDYWLSYTPFDAIALSGSDMRSMPPAVLAAMWRYAESGGNLIVLGGGVEFPGSWKVRSEPRIEGGRMYGAGFGQCFAFDANRIPVVTPASGVKEMLDVVMGTARFWQSLPDDNSANGSFPVVANSRVPIRGTVLIMLAFVVLIGPANIIFLSRTNRRTWLLWTIPAISLVTCLLVFAYSLLREGITPDARIESLTLLDQSSRRAATFGMEAFYCPLTPSQGLNFGFDTEATPLVEVNNWRGSGTRREVDWTEAQHFGRGWVIARVPAHFQVRKSETRRERIQLDKADGRLSVVNGLGAGITRLWLADAAGNISQAGNIAAGQKGELHPDTASPNVTEQLGPSLFRERIGCAIQDENVASTIPTYLQPGSYVAELSADPFVENGLGARAKSARVKERALVYGILEPNAFEP